MGGHQNAKSTNFSGLARPWLIGLLAFVVAGAIHLLNHHYLLQENPDSLREGISVITSDDASYIRPALNVLEIGEWKDNSIGRVAYVLRSPGYGMIAAVFFSLFGYEIGLFALLFFQLALWSLAVSVLPFLGTVLGFKRKHAYVIASFVAMMPMFSGFLSYTLTEGVTPSLVILFYASLFYGIKSNRKFILVSSLLLGFLLIVRPALLVLVLSYLPHFRTSFRQILSALIIALMPLLIWQLRVQRITGDFDLHPIYQSDAADLYRPLHGSIWDFHKMTGQTGAEFHSAMNELWLAARDETSKIAAAQNVVSSFDPTVLESIDEAELKEFYSNYVDILQSQQPYFDSQTPIMETLSGEDSLIVQVRKFKSQYVLDNLFRANILVPFEVLKEATIHSNLSLYIFQKPLRGNFFIEFLRWLSLITHVLIFVLASFGIIVFSSKWSYSLLLPGVLFLLYLIFVQRGIEERYMLPFLVPFLLGAISTIKVLRLSILNSFVKSVQ
ncbi:MAG: hypothetical protein AAGC47_01505 [Bacteroidota bacterium]